MRNDYWNRHFLICNKMASDILGFGTMNFAEMINEENDGRFGNTQMTKHFRTINAVLCDLMCEEHDFVYSETDWDTLAKLTPAELNKYYDEFCNGKMSISLVEE